MSLAALDNIDDALDATRSLLWPFDLGRWARLALIVFFIGGSGGGGANFAQFGGNTGTGGTPGAPGDPGQLPSLSEIVSSISPTEWAIIAAIGLTILVLVLTLGFVGSVMEFVFVESLSRERVSIREYWSDHWRRGGRLFGFRLVIGALTLAAFLGLFWVGFGAAIFGEATFSLGTIALAVLGMVFVGLVVSLVGGFTTQFVVPVMMSESRGVLGAWRRFWPTLTGEWKEYVVYIVLQFVLTLVAGIAVGLLVFVAALVVAIPLVILGVIGGVLIAAIPVAGWVVIAAAAVLFGLAMLVISLFAAVPVQTYLRYYALLVLGDTNEAFDLVAERRRAIRGGAPAE